MKVITFIIFFLFAGFYSYAQDKAEIKIREGLPTLHINGKPYPPFAYMSYLGEKEYYREVAGTGVHLYCFPAYLGDRGINSISGIGPFRKPIWIGEKQYDFSGIGEDFKKIIEADPSAKVIIRLYLDPPLWWEQAHPDEACRLPDGTTFRQSFYSERWRKESAGVITDVYRWIMNSPYKKHLIGLHVAAGGTEEWFFHPPQQLDTNPHRTTAFRQWLSRRYKHDHPLQSAWNDKKVTLRNAEPIDVASDKPVDRWRMEKEEQRFADTYQFQAENTANNIAWFCKHIKEISKGRLLTGAFYGYHYVLTDARAGHTALYKLLQCPHLDYLSSPNDYNRVTGEDWPPFTAIHTIQLQGKLWLAENDTRTSITTLLKERAPAIAPQGFYDSGVWLGPKDMETSVALLWKNAGRMLAYGYGGWWFDMWGGWFSDPQLLEVISKTNQLYTNSSGQDKKPMPSQVAVVVDEQLCLYDNSFGKLTNQILSNRYSLGKIGTPYDLFLRPDAGKLSGQYKVVWLLGLLNLSREERQIIEKWKEEGITVILTDNKGTHFFSPDTFHEGKTDWSAAELRVICKDAGVHIYNDSDDVTYAGLNWICIHSVEGGKRSIRLPFSAEVIQYPGDHRVSGATNHIDLLLEPSSTILLQLK